jgi:hypothetical protein
LIEVRCPEHGLERFRIKVIKRYNLAANIIQAKNRSKQIGEITCLYVGRNVSQEEVKNYLTNYFREKNMLEAITKIRLQA